jgi:hypothetical protein
VSRASRQGFVAPAVPTVKTVSNHGTAAPHRYDAQRQGLDFDPRQPYHRAMTKLLDQALEAVRLLPPANQDEIARVIMQLAGADLPAPVSLSLEEREAIARSKAAAARGEFATDEEVRAVWAKHGL